MPDRLVPPIDTYKENRSKGTSNPRTSLTYYWERAIRRVHREPRLRKYSYLLTDFWAIIVAPIPLWLANEKPNELNALMHYAWICARPVDEIEEWAKEREVAYKRFIVQNFDVLKEKVCAIPVQGAQRARTIGLLLDLVYSGQIACEDGRLAEAAGYLRESINLLRVHLDLPFVHTGYRVCTAISQAHAKQYGTREQIQKRWDEYQQFIELQHKQFPKHNHAVLLAATAKHFAVSPKTIYRHTHKPL